MHHVVKAVWLIRWWALRLKGLFVYPLAFISMDGQ